MKICGLDEVGRGALAGPLVAVGVCLPDVDISLKDSKQLSRTNREKLYQEILNTKVEVVVESISVDQINKYGIGWANIEIFERILGKINADKYIVDGNLRLENRTNKSDVRCLIRADQSHQSVMAASIVAKVTRDRLMRDLDRLFPMYAWSENCGYGTRAHIEAIIKHGPSLHHRSQFVSTAVRNALAKVSV